MTVLLDNLRSAFNVGSFFRTADAASIERLVLAGITSAPPHKGVLKTALGAEDSVPWEHVEDARTAALQLRDRGYEIAAIETGVHSVDLFDWRPQFPVCVIFGNELEGVKPELALDVRHVHTDTHARLETLAERVDGRRNRDV